MMSEDPICPLKKCWCVVGMENIWANRQEDDITTSIDFDLDNNKNWIPFLDSNRKAQFFGIPDKSDKHDRRVWRSSRN